MCHLLSVPFIPLRERLSLELELAVWFGSITGRKAPETLLSLPHLALFPPPVMGYRGVTVPSFLCRHYGSEFWCPSHAASILTRSPSP